MGTSAAGEGIGLPMYRSSCSHVLDLQKKSPQANKATLLAIGWKEACLRLVFLVNAGRLGEGKRSSEAPPTRTSDVPTLMAELCCPCSSVLLLRVDLLPIRNTQTETKGKQENSRLLALLRSPCLIRSTRQRQAPNRKRKVWRRQQRKRDLPSFRTSESTALQPRESFHRTHLRHNDITLYVEE
jgi:hypothetical protein